MGLSPAARKLLLTAHVAVAVGWIGALAGFLVLSIAGLVSADVMITRSVYLAMDLLNRFVIVPAALLSVLTGVVQSLGTPWGLLRHYWVVFKFLLILTATVMLLAKTGPISDVARAAAEAALTSSDMRGLRLSIMGHAIGGLAVLLWAMALGIYKPKATTPFRNRSDITPESMSQ